MRISDWSSDVCSSDLSKYLAARCAKCMDSTAPMAKFGAMSTDTPGEAASQSSTWASRSSEIGRASCRERVCQYGVDLGGRRIIKKKNIQIQNNIVKTQATHE